MHVHVLPLIVSRMCFRRHLWLPLHSKGTSLWQPSSLETRIHYMQVSIGFFGSFMSNLPLTSNQNQYFDLLVTKYHCIKYSAYISYRCLIRQTWKDDPNCFGKHFIQIIFCLHQYVFIFCIWLDVTCQTNQSVYLFIFLLFSFKKVTYKYRQMVQCKLQWFGPKQLSEWRLKLTKEPSWVRLHIRPDKLQQLSQRDVAGSQWRQQSIHHHL